METALVLLLQVALWAEVTRDDGARASGRSSWCWCCWSSRARTASSPRGSACLFLALRRDRARARAGAARGGALHRGPGGLAARVLRPPAAQHLLREGLGPARRPHRRRRCGSSPISPSTPACCRTSSCWPRPRWQRRARDALAFEPLFAACWLALLDLRRRRRLRRALPPRARAAGRRGARAVGGGGPPRAGRGGRRRRPRASSSLPLAADRRFRYAGAKYDRWIELGRFLGRPEHRGKTIAVDAAGKIPYYSRLAAIDMLGLTDAHIGHRPAATLPRRPQQARRGLRPRAPPRPDRDVDRRGPRPAVGPRPRALRGGGLPAAVARLRRGGSRPRTAAPSSTSAGWIRPRCRTWCATAGSTRWSSARAGQRTDARAPGAGGDDDGRPRRPGSRGRPGCRARRRARRRPRPASRG